MIHCVALLLGSERRLSCAEFEQFFALSIEPGQTTLEAPCGWVDIAKVTRGSGGRTAVTGWFTERKLVRSS